MREREKCRWVGDSHCATLAFLTSTLHPTVCSRAEKQREKDNIELHGENKRNTFRQWELAYELETCTCFLFCSWSGFCLIYCQLNLVESMRSYWCGRYMREVAMEWQYNENSIEEEKQGASVLYCCALLVRNLPYSSPRPIHCDLISAFLFFYITPQSNYCILFSNSLSLSLSHSLI